jgi:hypothetical protein
LHVATYAPRDPSGTVRSHVLAAPLETLLASRADDPEATGLPVYVVRAFYDYLRDGILACVFHGFLPPSPWECGHAIHGNVALARFW